MPIEHIFTVEEAAEKLGLSPSHVRRLLKEEKLTGAKLGREWMVTELDYSRKRRPKGEQSGEKS